MIWVIRTTVISEHALNPALVSPTQIAATMAIDQATKPSWGRRDCTKGKTDYGLPTD
jgi:hypothetical protein